MSLDWLMSHRKLAPLGRSVFAQKGAARRVWVVVGRAVLVVRVRLIGGRSQICAVLWEKPALRKRAW
jgi:hypothetical protein